MDHSLAFHPALHPTTIPKDNHQASIIKDKENQPHKNEASHPTNTVDSLERR